MNKDQNLIAEIYDSIIEASPVQQQMRNAFQQKWQQRMAKAGLNQSQSRPNSSIIDDMDAEDDIKRQKIENLKKMGNTSNPPSQPVQQSAQQPTQQTQAANFDGASGLPITPEGDKLFAQTPNPAETLRQNGFKSLEHFQAARDAGSWTPSSKQQQSTQPQQQQSTQPQQQQSTQPQQQQSTQPQQQQSTQPQQQQSTQPQQQQSTQQAGNTQQVQTQMAELGKQLTQFQQKFNEIMKSLGGEQPTQQPRAANNQG
jgi:hypothetical protein